MKLHGQRAKSCVEGFQPSCHRCFFIAAACIAGPSVLISLLEFSDSFSFGVLAVAGFLLQMLCFLLYYWSCLLPPLVVLLPPFLGEMVLFCLLMLRLPFVK